MAGNVDSARGALFKNERKEGNQPDYRGEIEIMQPLQPGKYFLSSWLKTSGQGNKYLSIAVGGPKNAVQPQRPDARPAAPKRETDWDDDAPF